MLLATGLAAKIEYSSNKLRRETVDANLSATTEAIVEAIELNRADPDADHTHADAMRDVFVRRLQAAGMALRSIIANLDEAAVKVTQVNPPRYE